MINAFTIDVEDYYQVSGFEAGVDRGSWCNFESRVTANTHRLLSRFHFDSLSTALAADHVGTWLKTVRFDLALAFCSSMVQYVAAAQDVPLIVDLVDVDSQKWMDYSLRSRGWRRWLFRLEGRRLRRLERSLPARCRAVTLAGEAEAQLFRGVCPNERTVGIANGVDLDYFVPRPPTLAAAANTNMNMNTETATARCVFVGALDYRANVQGLEWFCEHCWPAIRRHRPDATLDLVGRQPGAAMRRLGQLPGVRLVGQVPDVRPYVWQATIALAPLLTARGIQNKVLEALALGRPMVASPQALEGLDCRLDEHVLQATTAAEWSAAVLALLADPARQRRLAEAGRAFVEQHHSWSAQLARLQPLLQPPEPIVAAGASAVAGAAAGRASTPPGRRAGRGATR